MRRNKTILDLVNFRIQSINKYLLPSGQKLKLYKQKDDEGNIYFDLKYEKDLDAHTVLENHVFGGEDYEIFSCLSGLETGIKLQRNMEVE